MTETPPERLVEEPAATEEDLLDDFADDLDPEPDLDPERPADDVDEDRLSKWAVYDNAERHYIGGAHSRKSDATRVLKALGNSERYFLRRV